MSWPRADAKTFSWRDLGSGDYRRPALRSKVPLAVIVALIVVGKFVVWTGVVRLFRYPLHTAVPVAMGLTQIGEFSFVLVQVARNAGILGSEIYNATLAASLVTILLNAALVRYTPAALARVGLARRVSPLSEGTPAVIILWCPIRRSGCSSEASVTQWTRCSANLRCRRS